jgi:hypothetical protein
MRIGWESDLARVRHAPAPAPPPARVLIALAACLAGCGPYLGTTSASFLRNVEKNPDPNIRYLAYSKLASPKAYDTDEQREKAASILAHNLQQGREPTATRAMICRTLGAIGRKSALPALRMAVNDEESLVRAEACLALGKIGEPEDSLILARVMVTDNYVESRVAAIDGLGLLKPKDPRVLAMLIENMARDEQVDGAKKGIRSKVGLTFATRQALTAITGKDYGDDFKKWKSYLDEHIARSEKRAGATQTAAASQNRSPVDQSGTIQQTNTVQANLQPSQAGSPSQADQPIPAGNQTTAGLNQPPPGIGQLPPGTGQLQPGNGQFPPESGQLPPGTGQLSPGSGQLPPGTGQVSPGSGQLPPGNGQLPPDLPPAQAFSQPLQPVTKPAQNAKPSFPNLARDLNLP